MTRIVTTVTIRRPIALVFDYVTTPANWPAWHPASRSVSGEAGHSLGPGEEVVEDFVVAGRPGRATWRVTGCDAPTLWSIEAANAEGQASITYRLAERGEETVFVRDLAYTVATPWLAVLDVVLMRRESQSAVRRLKQILESPVPENATAEGARDDMAMERARP